METKCRDYFEGWHGSQAAGKGDLARIMNSGDNDKMAAYLTNLGVTECVWIGGGRERDGQERWHWGGYGATNFAFEMDGIYPAIHTFHSNVGGARNKPFLDIPMTYTSWRSGYPASGLEQVGMLFCPSDGKWISSRQTRGNSYGQNPGGVCMLSCDNDAAPGPFYHAIIGSCSQGHYEYCGEAPNGRCYPKSTGCPSPPPPAPAESGGDPCDTSEDCGEMEYCDQQSGSCVWSGRKLSDNDPNPYSRFPGDARDSHSLPNVQQIFVRDFNLDGKPDLFLHAPALSPGSCAQRCHSLGRFGYDRFEVHRTGAPSEGAHEKSYCYCGPAYKLMIAPHPPPSPPKPPPYPPNPPPPEPVPSPVAPPPSPPFP